jgi:cell pole-organizing protein PopZ
LLPPLKPADAPAGPKPGEIAPISTVVEAARQADPASKEAVEEVKPAIEEESAFDAISALGALAAGLAKSSSAPVVALAAVEEVKKTLPQAVKADVELPPSPSIEAPVVRAGQASYAPVKPKLPEAPKFLAPAPAPTAQSPAVDFPPAGLESPPVPAAAPLPASPVAAAVEPQVDALAMLSAAMGTANPVESTKAPAGVPTPPVLPLSAMLNSSSEPEDTPERTLEDTVAELLRPMLRQWLSDNMPRIVEKALRIELAQSLRPGGKTRI